MFPETIFKYITQQETDYQTREIQIGDNWRWGMKKHIQMIFHLKNGVFYTGENDYLRAFREVMGPIIELSNWTEDLEVKDVVFYLDGQEDRALSFLIKKYHDEIYVKEHNLDEFFDEVTESDNTYGGTLVDISAKERPKAIALTKIAFADQTDILGSPLGLKMYFSPSKLRKMDKNGWGKEENGANGTIEDLIQLADFSKDAEGAQKDHKENQTPGKNIEVYIVRGDLPKGYIDDSDDTTVQNQLQVVAFYTDQRSKKQEGFILYRKKENKETLKFFTSSPVSGRGLGRGDGEKMLHPQIWSNFLEIHKMQMLEAGAKVPLGTDDETFNEKNKVQDMENLEIMTLQEGRRVFQIPTAAATNIQLYERAADKWLEQAQFSGAAFDPIIGKEPPSGTTFRGQERNVAQGRGSHDRKRGKRAKFIEEIYRDKIIPDIKKELINGNEFVASLDLSELEWVTDRLVTKEMNRRIKDVLLKGKDIPTPEEQEFTKDRIRETYLKGGEKRLLGILKDELKDIEIKIGINIAGKQKDLVGLTNKILSVFQFIFANPQAFEQIRQLPNMDRAFNDILEFSNISPASFSSAVKNAEQNINQTGDTRTEAPELNLQETPATQ